MQESIMSQMSCRHLLIKHQGSRRLASWRDPDGKEIRQRTKEAQRIIGMVEPGMPQGLGGPRPGGEAAAAVAPPSTMLYARRIAAASGKSTHGGGRGPALATRNSSIDTAAEASSSWRTDPSHDLIAIDKSAHALCNGDSSFASVSVRPRTVVHSDASKPNTPGCTAPACRASIQSCSNAAVAIGDAAARLPAVVACCAAERNRLIMGAAIC